LAQGTHWAVALAQAFFLARARSLPRAVGAAGSGAGESLPGLQARYHRRPNQAPNTRHAGFRGSRPAPSKRAHRLTRSPLEGEKFLPLSLLTLHSWISSAPLFPRSPRPGREDGEERGALARRRARPRQRSSRTAVPKRDSARQGIRAKSRTQRAPLVCEPLGFVRRRFGWAVSFAKDLQNKIP
jgi:hypothetical protein